MSSSPTQKPSWRKLEKLSAILKDKHLNDLFAKDKNRFNDLSLKTDGFFFDYSKQRLTKEVIYNLCGLLKESDFDNKRRAMFSGDAINNTEDRAVLHTALRRPITDEIVVNGDNITPLIHSTLEKMKEFSNVVRSGKHKGTTGKTIKKIISIGIGGSDLGPRLVSEALKTLTKTTDTMLETEFVSNIDGDDIQSALKASNAEETLFIVISKSFKTQETLANALTARKWLKDNLPKGVDIAPHFVAVSSNIKAVEDFGINPNNVFPMWDWVNGRFSLWSAVGLPLCLQHGFDKFEQLLDGAHNMDQHFLNAPLDQNVPVLMALIGIWNRNFLDLHNLAILPYAQNLFYFPAYLQQLEMESNGKNVDYDGNAITDYKTCPIIFGEVGVKGQHSFYQLFHQGSETIPCDFIGIITPKTDLPQHHELLLNNMLAQSQTMMQGSQNPSEPYRYFEGNKPSSTLLTNEMTPYSLGQLIALYEHKTFTQGIVWNLNSFDQFGVELGKELAQKLEKQDLSEADPSTKGLNSLIHKR